MKTASVHVSAAPLQGGLVCKRCGGSVFERLQRIGLVQRRILPFFNLYPWRCVICNNLKYYTARNIAELRRRAERS